MNRIVIKKVCKNDNWTDFEWFIDDVSLSEHLKQNKIKELPANTEPFDDLCPAWTKSLNYFGDVRFTWELLTYEKAVLPIYLCPDDLDYSCIVIVVEVKKTKDFVYWEQETLEEVQNYHTKQMTVKDCAHLIKKLKRTGSNELIEHIDTYGEILLHLYASEQVCEPLVELLKHNNLCDYVEIYCRTIELMWRYGDEAVKNVVDVTLLAKLSSILGVNIYENICRRERCVWIWYFVNLKNGFRVNYLSGHRRE